MSKKDDSRRIIGTPITASDYIEQQKHFHVEFDKDAIIVETHKIFVCKLSELKVGEIFILAADEKFCKNVKPYSIFIKRSIDVGKRYTVIMGLNKAFGWIVPYDTKVVPLTM